MRRSRLVSRALVPVLAGLLTAGVLPAVVASAAPVRAVAPAAGAVPQPPQHRGTPDRVAPAGLPADAGQPMPAATRVRELTDRRTAYGTFFELSDGRVQAEISTSPVHYRDGQGRWQDIDTRVGDSDRPGFAKAAVHSGFGSLFGDRSDRLLRVEVGGRHVEFGLPGTPRAVTPTAADSRPPRHRGVRCLQAGDVVVRVPGQRAGLTGAACGPDGIRCGMTDFATSSGYTVGPATGEAIGGTASDGRPAQLGVSSGDAASIFGARDSEQVQKMERVGGGPLASAINIYAGKGLDAAIADSRNTDLAPWQRAFAAAAYNAPPRRPGLRRPPRRLLRPRRDLPNRLG